ncbi:DUF5348 domain-containing protein [Alicyclobacillus fodiniaquatilis]|uniref:DUF5348 domain-containing protein n=1 Tax=Alicyclobacillus fodiniaquatilis TaxID=1661150 RepID=A0ABW4JHY9_9BACL
MNTEEALLVLNKLKPSLEHIQRSIADMTKPEGNIEALTLYQEMQSIEDKLFSVIKSIQWMKRPVAAQGRLLKRSDGRYIIEDTDVFFTSGDVLDVLVNEEDDSDSHWVPTRMEYANDDYYIFALGQRTRIDGVTVRVKESLLSALI